jgi:3-hydroxyisobutyrate dehydrogenase-like beta-hydroxyacid dehydrogenase
MIDGLAADVGAATPLLDQVKKLFRTAKEHDLADEDVACLVKVISGIARPASET